MRFDDRLATLLTLPVAGPRDRAVRWRQLVELAARVSEAGIEDDAPMIAALAVIRSERAQVPIEVRSATGRGIAGRALGEKMLTLFAEEELAVAAPVLAAASVAPEHRQALVAAADGPTRTFLKNLWPEQGDGEAEGRRLGEVVERLKAARTTIAETTDLATLEERDEPAAPSSPPPAATEPESTTPESEPLPGGTATTARPRAAGFTSGPLTDRDKVSAFRWESGPDGAIDWVDSAPRAALVGQSLAATSALASFVGSREPFVGIDGRFAGLPGEWQVTGNPEYDPDSGHFLGYRGAALRKQPGAPVDTGPPIETGLPLDPAALRELVHEIKTPLNAIIGFAEIIDGQYLGPAHRRYRERAAQIVTEARILLEAIKDLDFAARLQGGREEGEPELFVDILNRLRPVLEARAARRDVELAIPRGKDASACATNPRLAARLVERLVAALIDTAPMGDGLRLRIDSNATHCILSIERPRSLDRYDKDELFDPALLLEDEGEALLGIGFSLRLVRGLARVAGGDLVIDNTQVRLSLVRAD